jgi:hypothetical protein
VDNCHTAERQCFCFKAAWGKGGGRERKPMPCAGREASVKRAAHAGCPGAEPPSPAIGNGFMISRDATAACQCRGPPHPYRVRGPIAVRLTSQWTALRRSEFQSSKNSTYAAIAQLCLPVGGISPIATSTLGSTAEKPQLANAIIVHGPPAQGREPFVLHVHLLLSENRPHEGKCIMSAAYRSACPGAGREARGRIVDPWLGSFRD